MRQVSNTGVSSSFLKTGVF